MNEGAILDLLIRIYPFQKVSPIKDGGFVCLASPKLAALFPGIKWIPG
jgi:hypothetical protein